jgi:hypothetical protein
VANSRRWQTYAIRSFGVAALLVAMASRAGPSVVLSARDAGREYAWLGQSYFYAIVGVELALVMLAAPAATAGAICLDRARGTLAHVLVTDLSDPEIVLGKLAARLLPVLGLIACSWPVLAISSLLGGIDPAALTLAFAVILAVALLGCTMALAFSVWARKAHEVILATYTAWGLCLLLWPIWVGLTRSGAVGPPPRGTLLLFNPFYVALAPYADPGKAVSASVGLFLLVTVGCPILYLLAGDPTYLRGLTLASPLVAISLLLFDIYSHDVILEILWWVAYWDVMIALLTVVVAGLAIRTLDRRFRRLSPQGNGVQQQEPAGQTEGAWQECHRGSTDSGETASSTCDLAIYTIPNPASEVSAEDAGDRDRLDLQAMGEVG